MLRIRFLNVGDGDAILVEDLSGRKPFRMLVDTGRARVSEGEPSMTCAEHLQRLGIRHINKLVVTHLHADHMGGVDGVRRCARIDELISGFIPKSAGAQMAWDSRADRAVRGMIVCVNQWSKDIAKLKSHRCRTTELYQSWYGLRLTENLSMDLIVPSVRDLCLQRSVWNHLLERRAVAPPEKARASRLRNPNSLRVRLHYAEREIELSGDCYACVWDGGDVMPCDLFKVPHHGDDKGATLALLKKLRPAHAVISCSRYYQAAKNRPSPQVIDNLRAAGAQVWFTDAYSDGTTPAVYWPSADFIIRDDGTLEPPIPKDF